MAVEKPPGGHEVFGAAYIQTGQLPEAVHAVNTRFELTRPGTVGRPLWGVEVAFAVPHEVHGQEVHAAIVAPEGQSVDAEEVAAFTRERVAAYKYPRVIHVVDSLPLGPSGKVLKRVLTDQFAPGGDTEPTPHAASSTG
ncbi:hypothetical protein [Glaciihabitans sp. UYNi722]|uniref:AMP-binding enzyme n=1 Tax=Glaciihabitans sp. UYNi722 TaxID=3156344 RepID=UPI003395071A